MLKKLSIAFLGLTFALALPTMAKAETVMERIARTRVIRMAGSSDVIPYSYFNEKNQLVGYSIDLISLIEQEVSRFLGKPVKVDFQSVRKISELIPKVAYGQVDIACNTQFTWERENFVDFSLPYSLSGIRLLAKKGSLKGDAASLVGKKVAVLPNSLGEKLIKSIQPQATLVKVSGVNQAIEALVSGKADAIAGDTVVLAGAIQKSNPSDYEVVPAQPLARYGVGCMIPEDNSSFRNLVNQSIARMLQGYLDDDPKYSAMVNKWVGSQGIVDLPTELIKAYFQSVLFSYEEIPLTGVPAPSE
ncbi:MAG TPA: amino acid ABC transporter substrate-binding protein [Cyanothece sp. UBA12306]|nr:amino acid ABC transporter substrate-binding protein [Cyanothece sp. UBA12306]